MACYLFKILRSMCLMVFLNFYVQYTSAQTDQVVLNHLDTINVKSFGAKGDNLQNDSAAFERAIKYTSGKKKVLLVPSGKYKISNLLIYPGCSITGQDSSSVLILNNSTQNNRQCLLLTGISQNVTLTNLKFDANGSNNTGNNIFCIKTLLGNRETLGHLSIKNCYFTGSKNYGALFLIGLTNQITDIAVSGCIFNNTGSCAVCLRGINGFKFINNTVSAWSRLDKSNAAVAFQSEVCSNIIFYKNHFKNKDAAHFAVECAGTRVIKGKFTENIFDGNGYDASGISGVFDHCLFKNNKHLNGGGSHRSGYELVGDNDTIANNLIERGSISLGAGVPNLAFSKGGSGYVVIENKVTANFGVNNNCLSIGGLDTVKGARIENNIFDNSQGKGNAPVIALGQRGPAINITIKNNKLFGAPNNACIRMNIADGSPFSGNIVISHNIMAGEDGIQIFDMGLWKRIEITGNNFTDILKAVFLKTSDFTTDFKMKSNLMPVKR